MQVHKVHAVVQKHEYMMQRGYYRGNIWYNKLCKGVGNLLATYPAAHSQVAFEMAASFPSCLKSKYTL